MHQEVVWSRRDVERLKEQVENLIEEHGTTVHDDLDSHLTEIMVAKSNEVESLHEEGTFGRAFWDTQKRALSVKKLSAMRWDPVIIHWCLYLCHLVGNSAYEMLRESGLSSFHHRENAAITHIIQKQRLGLEMTLTSSLWKQLKSSLVQREKYVIPVMDKMHIKEDIVHDKHTW